VASPGVALGAPGVRLSAPVVTARPGGSGSHRHLAGVMEAPRAGDTVMFESVVMFATETSVRADVLSIRHTNLHMHPGVVQIVYVLQGDLHVRVSCETFDLEPGDFAVLNAGDPHLLKGSADNVTAVVYLDLAQFREVDPFVQQIIFACESFDLARYRRQEALIRGLLLDVIDGAVDAPGAARTHPPLRDCSVELVRLLSTGYSLENYYNRESSNRGGQREKFLTILGHVRDHIDKRDVLDLTADALHYSKSYVSHLVKEVSAISFSDLLGFLRVARAESLLLTTDDTMLEIAAACGFSDVKYFTRTFVDWFHQSPMEYRKRYRPEILRDSDVTDVAAEVALGLVREHRRLVASPADGPRLSITPLLLKNVGSRLDLFDAVGSHRHDRPPGADRTDRTDPQPGRRHLVPIRVEMSDLDAGYLLDGLASFDQINATPCLVLEYAAKATTLALVDAVAARLPTAPGKSPAIWLVYGAIHDRAGVDHVIARAQAEHGLEIQAILIT
jgi:AraC-like DNA-binding protein/mannose-6-phosphate isomerase-like protein (cupin superfamily)